MSPLLAGRDVLGIMPTGAGKSVCFQLPALAFSGMTLVISPLISLMKDQVAALVEAGISGAYLNSALTPSQHSKVLQRAAEGRYKILYVAPERLETDGFLSFARNAAIAMVAVDEAHCVSQWGQDFRPSYLKISKFIQSLPTRPVVGAFTATATGMVRQDMVRLLALKDPYVTVTGFDRPNLYFRVERPADKFRALIDILEQNKGKSGIVYCATRKTVEEVCQLLETAGYAATRYHAGLPEMERHNNQDDFIFDRKTLMVATNAFGMGIDKSNVSLVVHYNMPKNLESYYQEAGRAGRDGSPAECVLLYAKKDVSTNRYFIENGEENDQLTHEERLVQKEREYQRLKKMTLYCATAQCLRAYILRYFGEEAPRDCGYCSNCDTRFETVDITVDAQKIVSCVFRLLQKMPGFGKNLLIDVLRGANIQAVERHGLNTLSTFGIMADTPPEKIHKVVDFLIENGYLHQTDADKPLIELTPKSNAIIKERKQIFMKTPTETPVKKEARRVDPVLEADGLLSQLKKVRSRLASEGSVPAYVIFSDAALMDMCRQKPNTPEAFLEISGVGKAKLEKYGKIFMDAIADYTGNPVSAYTAKSASFREEVLKKGVYKAYQPWTEEEDERLKDAFSREVSLEEMKKAHQRTGGAISSRLRKLGLIE